MKLCTVCAVLTSRPGSRCTEHARQREALRIFGDDLTDESAARLRAVVDGRDGFGWGGLA